MNRLASTALALLAVLAPLGVLAEDNPNTFSDPAMSFTAPAGFKRVQIPPHDPVQFEQKSIVAAFVKDPGTQNAMGITISMENFEGSANGYATSADNDLRGSADGVFIKRSNATLSNGMPAIFEEVTIGSGFAQVMEYRYIWADGVRGVELGETARYGAIDERKAKADLAMASAVAYPRNRY